MTPGQQRKERLAYDSGERVKVIVKGDSCIELTIGETEIQLSADAVRRVIQALQAGLAIIDAKDTQ